MILCAKGCLVAVVLFAAAGPGAARELQLTSGVVRSIETCEETGTLLRYRAGDAWYVVAKTQVRRIEPPCGTESPPAGVGTNPSAGATSAPLQPPGAAPSAPDPGQAAVASPSTQPSEATPSPSTFSTTTSDGKVHVQGYTRKDGTYVPSHTRSAPGSGTGRRR